MLVALCKSRLLLLLEILPRLTRRLSDISYFIGFDFGSRLSGQKFTDKELDIKELTAGIVDALAKKDIRLTDDQVNACVTSLDAMMQKKAAEMQQEFLEVAKANLAKANQYLEENKKKDGVQTTKTGLQYKVIKSGTGKQPTVADEVIIHYEGKTSKAKYLTLRFKETNLLDSRCNELFLDSQKHFKE
jgi:FKBP-type peptidyl-prolyl cis-trans isomerase